MALSVLLAARAACAQPVDALAFTETQLSGVNWGQYTADVGTKHEIEDAAGIEVTDVRPNHESYRCLIGFYERDPDASKRKLTLFSGSTVPAPYYIRGYYDKVNNKKPFHTTATFCRRAATCSA
jgi:hypothetical protein